MTTAPPSAPDDERIATVTAFLADVLGDADRGARQARRHDAQKLSESAADDLELPTQQLVYGELDVASVARILDACDVHAGDRFVDLGSGDGIPTFAAALLYPDAFARCRGIEIVPALARRAETHAGRFADRLARASLSAAPVELLEGDLHDLARADVAAALSDSTLALCFATTWSHAPRRTLPRLSTTLHRAMPRGARVVLVDARLVESDGWRWEGDLRIVTPDTAPHSTARLYTRR